MVGDVAKHNNNLVLALYNSSLEFPIELITN